MQQGIVKWYYEVRGYGFIEDEQRNEIFVHKSGLELEKDQKLQEGQSVLFEVVTGVKGPQAVHVKLIEATAKE